MKKLFTVIAILLSASAYSQEMKVHKTNGSVESFLLSTIDSITFTNSSQGLVAYYPFSGNANDESGNGNNGTIYGAELTTDRFGNTNSAYYFNGNSLISASNSTSLNTATSQITISSWVNVENIVTSDVQNIVNKMGSASTKDGYTLEINYPQSGINDPTFAIYNPIVTWINSPTPIEINNWAHVVAVYNGSEMKIYFNGTLDKSTPASGNITNGSTDLGIGARTISSDRNYFHGKLDDVRIYNRALAESEILQLYHEGGWAK